MMNASLSSVSFIARRTRRRYPHGGRDATRGGRGASAAASTCLVRRPSDPGTHTTLPRGPTGEAPHLSEDDDDAISRDEGEQGVLSRGGEEVQRGAEGQVREVRVRWRGHLVHPRPRGLRRALRGTRRRVGHRCHPHRVKVIRDKDDNRLSAHMTRRRESPLERDAPARRYTRAPTTNAKTRGHPLNIDVACKLFKC